jgi:Outer membrane lipoprotein carrier protein LolA-like
MKRSPFALLALACLCAVAAINPGAVTAGANPAVPATRVAAGELDAVMDLLAMRRQGRVEFVEQQFIAVLKHPIESSGELRYEAPDRLEKRTLLPRPETLVLAGGELTVDRGGRKHVLDLHRYPQILPFVESIRATLAGDRNALERVFHLEFSGTVARWSLTLAPLDPQLTRVVKQVQIDGAKDELLKVEIRQADGDRSLMTLRTPATP